MDIMPSRAEERFARLGVLLAIACTVLLVFSGLGSESLLGDEALYSAIARDSRAAGAWFPPIYDGVPYTGKPPVGIWILQLAFSFFGFDELVARFPFALAGAAAIGIFGWALRKRHGVFVAVLAVLLLATGHHLLFRHGLRQAVFEGPLLLGLVIAILSLSGPRREGPLRHAALFGSVFAALFKGLIAPALLLAFGIPFALLAGPDLPDRFRSRLALAVAGGFAASALPILLFGAVAGIDPVAWVRRDVWERATTGLDAGHVAGVDVYAGVLGRDFGVWLLLAAAAAWTIRSQGAGPGAVPRRAALALALAWSCGPMLLLLISASKLPWYLYPTLPGFALFVALGAEVIRCRLSAIRPFLGVGFAILLILLVLPRFADRMRRATSSRPEQVTLRALVDFAADEPRAVVVFDRPESHGWPPVREWNWLYLGQAPRRKFALEPVPPEVGCPLLVSARPDEAAAAIGLAESPRLSVHRVTRDEAPLWIVDGCGGAIADRLSGLTKPPTPAGSTG
jgi:4-amino-4-deoxy-L-arabinose transferase-like glycosyltransferase